MKQIIRILEEGIMLRFLIGISLVSFMVVLCPILCSIIEKQTSLFIQTLILFVFVSLCALVCGISVGLINRETKKR